MGIATLKHQVETSHHIQDQIFKILPNIILDHNHLVITETEFVHEDRSHKIDSVMLETILTHY